MNTNEPKNLTTSAENPVTASVEDIEKAIAMLTADPIADFMRSQGHDPADGWIMVCPLSWCRGPWLKHIIYSRFSDDVFFFKPPDPFKFDIPFAGYRP